MLNSASPLLEKASVAAAPSSKNWFALMSILVLRSKSLTAVQYCLRSTLQLVVGRLFWEMPHHIRMMMPTMEHYLSTLTDQ